MNIIEAYKIVEGFVPFNESAVAYEAMQTLKSAVLAQQPLTEQSAPCECRGASVNPHTYHCEKCGRRL
jgi:hypothetical protein